ncbi:MAG: thioredoxin family protein [Candidatus Aminicenantia bacterium]
MRDINESEFTNLIQKENIVLIEFGAEWCGPCKKMRPILEKIEKDFDSKIEIYFFDVSRSPQKASEYGILSIPQILLFKGGMLKDRLFGEQKRESVRNFIEKYI